MAVLPVTLAAPSHVGKMVLQFWGGRENDAAFDREKSSNKVEPNNCSKNLGEKIGKIFKI
jgi:hypothetical protein